MTDTAIRTGQASSGPAPHPLDPATGAEYLAGREIMAAAGLLPGGDGAPVRFAYYGLAEPPKDDVLNAKAPDRRLRAYLVDTATGESTDVVVSPVAVLTRNARSRRSGALALSTSSLGGSARP